VNLNTDINLSLAFIVAPVDDLEGVGSGWKFGSPLTLRVVVQIVHDNTDAEHRVSLSILNQVSVDEWIFVAVSTSWVVSWVGVLGSHEQLLGLWHFQSPSDNLLGHADVLEWSDLTILLGVSDTEEVEVLEVNIEWQEVFAIISQSMASLLQEFWSPVL